MNKEMGPVLQVGMCLANGHLGVEQGVADSAHCQVQKSGRVGVLPIVYHLLVLRIDLEAQFQAHKLTPVLLWSCIGSLLLLACLIDCIGP